MIDLGTIDNGEETEEAEPVQITVAYKVAGEQRTDEFTAHGQVPYGVPLAFLAAGQLGMTAQAAALLTLFEMSMPGEEWQRLYTLINDPVARIHAQTLQQVASKLVVHYTTPRLDPTIARDGGPKKSPGGRKATSSGSSGRARGKASTS